MVVVYKCKSCGYILFVFERVGQSSYGLPTPSELADMLGYHCPRCGRRLGSPSLDDVTVLERPRPLQEAARRSKLVSVKLPPELVEALDTAARTLGASRSAVIRLAVTRMLTASRG